MSERIKRVASRFCVEEARAFKVYSILADVVKGEHAKVFKRLAEQERKHYEFWKSVAGECSEPNVSKLPIVLAYHLLGPVYVFKMLEKGEKEAANEYSRLAKEVEDEEVRRKLMEIALEEEAHEKALLEEIEDVRVKYMSFIALGLADAIVEITGVNAGFLGATASTTMAGVAGLVVGFSASLSMAGAAYLQAKHGSEPIRPVLSALVTGVAYMLAVLLLVLPFFVLNSIASAFLASITVAVLLIAGFSYYSSIIEDKRFIREFTESTILMLGTAGATYVFGQLVGGLVGLNVIG